MSALSVREIPRLGLDISSIDSLLIAWWRMMMAMKQGAELDSYAQTVPESPVTGVERAFT